MNQRAPYSPTSRNQTGVAGASAALLPPIATRGKSPLIGHSHRNYQTSASVVTPSGAAAAALPTPTPIHANQMDDVASSSFAEKRILMERVSLLEKDNRNIRDELHAVKDYVAQYLSDHKHRSHSPSPETVRLQQMESMVQSTHSSVEAKIHQTNDRIRVLSEAVHKVHASLQEHQARTNSSTLNDISSLKHVIQEKHALDVQHLEREKQKAAVLFEEVVRLGKELEASEKRSLSALRELHDRMIKVESKETSGAAAAAGAAIASSVLHSSSNLHERMEQQLSQVDLQVASLKSAVFQLKSELDAERLERQEAGHEKAKWLSEVQASIVRVDAAMETKLSHHLREVQELSTREKNEIVQQIRKEQVGSSSHHEGTAVASVQFNEISALSDKVNAMEATLLDQFMKFQNDLSDIRAHGDSRVHNLSEQLLKEMMSRSTTQEQIENELRKRFNDLKDATGEITAELQTSVVGLEEVIRAEIKDRLRNEDNLRTRLESVIVSLTKAMEYTRSEVAKQQEVIIQKVNSVSDDRDSFFSLVEERIEAALRTAQRIQEQSMHGLETQVSSLTLNLTKEEETRNAQDQKLEDLVKKHKERTSEVFDGIQRILVTSQDEMRELIQTARASQSQDISFLSNSVEEMISNWTMDMQEEYHELQNEVEISFKTLKDTMREELQQTKNEIQGVWKYTKDMNDTKQVERCIHEVIEIVQEDQFRSQFHDISSHITSIASDMEAKRRQDLEHEEARLHDMSRSHDYWKAQLSENVEKLAQDLQLNQERVEHLQVDTKNKYELFTDKCAQLLNKFQLDLKRMKEANLDTAIKIEVVQSVTKMIAEIASADESFQHKQVEKILLGSQDRLEKELKELNAIVQQEALQSTALQSQLQELWTKKKQEEMEADMLWKENAQLMQHYLSPSSNAETSRQPPPTSAFGIVEAPTVQTLPDVFAME